MDIINSCVPTLDEILLLHVEWTRLPVCSPCVICIRGEGLSGQSDESEMSNLSSKMIFCFTDVSKINCKVWRKRFFLCWYLHILMEFYEDILFHIIVVAQNCIEKYLLCETSCTSVFFKLSFIIIFFLLKQYTFVRICMRYILKEVSGQVYTSDSKANIFKIYWDLPSWICMHTLH